jgi:peptide/nickel transport system ATP-binding protein
METILELSNVVKYFPISMGGVLRRRYNTCKAVDGISFSVKKGTIFGIAGESGSGKTTLAKLILLIEHITSGSITYKGKHVQNLSPQDIIWYRSEMQTVFQDAGSSLSPRMRIKDIVSEPLEVHHKKNLSSIEIRTKTEKTLSNVGLGANILDKFLHELSGGQKQRVAIARAIILEPSLIILDEPVCSLDVSIRGQILNLLLDLQEEHNLTYIIISHDLAMLQDFATDIAIMYVGEIIEMGYTLDIFQNPIHPYTKALLNAIPQTIPGRMKTTAALSGEIPNPIDPPSGCRFHPRCELCYDSFNECVKKVPELYELHRGHYVACNLARAKIDLETDFLYDSGRREYSEYTNHQIGK